MMIYIYKQTNKLYANFKLLECEKNLKKNNNIK